METSGNRNKCLDINRIEARKAIIALNDVRGE